MIGRRDQRPRIRSSAFFIIVLATFAYFVSAGTLLPTLLLSVTSVAVLMALRLIGGAGDAMFFVGGASAINDIAPEERRGEAVSMAFRHREGGLNVYRIAIGEISHETNTFCPPTTLAMFNDRHWDRGRRDPRARSRYPHLSGRHVVHAFDSSRTGSWRADRSG